MASEAERVAVDIVARLDGFTPKVRQGAASFGTDMEKIRASAVRTEQTIEQSMNRAAQSTQNLTQKSRLLGFQIADIGTQLSSGASPFLVLAQQGPQVANALDGAKGAVGRFAGFLSGPWGAALLAATTILGTFILKNRESGESVDDLVDKLRKDAEQSDKVKQAKERYAKSIDGVRDAMEDAEDAREETIRSMRTEAEQANINARVNLQNAIAIREKTKALLQNVKAQIEYNKAALGDPTQDNRATFAALNQDRLRVQEIEKSLADNQADINRARGELRRSLADVAGEAAARTLDPIEGIRRKYEGPNGLIEQAKRAAVAQGTVTTELAKQLTLLKRQQDAEEERAREGQRNQRKSKESSLPAVTGKEIAAALGTTITSGKRTAAQNKAVGGDANSYHLSGQAIDIPLTVNGKPLTKEGIRAALEPMGIVIKELLGPGDKGHSDHFHIAFDKKRRGPDDVAEAREKAADAEARLIEAEIERKARVANEEATLDDQVLRGKQDLANSAAEQARIENEAIDAAEQRYAAELAALVEENKRTDGLKGITAAEAEILKKKRAEVAELDRQFIRQQEQERIRKDNLLIAEGMLDNQLDLLRSEEDLATSQKERRTIALAILDAEHEKLRLALQEVIDSTTASDAQKEIARARLAQLDQLKANAKQSTLRDTAGPMEDYITGIRDTAAALDEEFEKIAVGSLQSVVDGLSQAAAGFTSLGDVALGVLGQITTALVKLALQQIILKTLGEQISGSATEAASGAKSASQAAASGAGAATAATVAQAASVAAAWAPAAAAASLATLGANAGPAIGALVATHALSLALSAAGGAAAKFASGGRVIGPGTGTSDSIPAMLSNGEFVIRKRAADNLGPAFLEEMNRTGRVPAFADGGPVMRTVRPSNAPVSRAGMGLASLSPDAVRELRSVVADAAQAMPPVNLYPTLDKAAAFQAMLNDPGSQRTFFNFVSNNSAKFNSALRR